MIAASPVLFWLTAAKAAQQAGMVDPEQFSLPCKACPSFSHQGLGLLLISCRSSLATIKELAKPITQYACSVNLARRLLNPPSSCVHSA